MTTATEAPGTRPAPGRRRVRRPARWVAGALLAVLVAVAIVAATRPTTQATQVTSALLTRAAPTLSGPTLTGGHLDLSSYRGRFVYVNFFAS